MKIIKVVFVFLYLQDIETGSMQHWKSKPSPDVAIRYWKLHVCTYVMVLYCKNSTSSCM